MSRPYMSTHYTSTQNVCMCVYVNTLQESMWLSVYVKTLYVNTLPQNMWVCGRYRDSARLLGESCWQKKIEGPLGEKIARKPRNSERWGSGGRGHVKKGANWRSPETKYKRWKNAFAITSITLTQVQRHCVCLQCVVVPCIPRCITLYHIGSRWHQHITTQTHTAHEPNLNTLQRTAPSYSKAHLSNLKSHTLLANRHLPNPQTQQALQLSAAGPTYWNECPPSFLCHVTYSQRRKELINYVWVSGRVAANGARPACRCSR